MKVLVTGASGLLGSNVVELLREHGYETRVMLRKSSNILGLAGLNPEIAYGDLNDPDSIREAAANCQAIVHCAANTKQWNTSWKEHLNSNLKGTKAVLAAARAQQHRKVVVVSTANTFPLIDQQPLAIDTDYIRSKKAAEDYVLRQTDIPAVVINPSFMIGARDVKPSSGQSILHYLNNNPVLCPGGGKSFIHVKDVAEAILKVLSADISGRRFLLANENMSYRSFFRLIQQETGQDRMMIGIPAALSMFLGKLGSLAAAKLGLQPKLNRENAALINTNLYYDGSEAYHELGIRKRCIRSAIREAVAWFEFHQYCKK